MFATLTRGDEPVGNYPVWDSGVAEVRGAISDGGRIRVRTRDGGKRTFPDGRTSAAAPNAATKTMQRTGTTR